MMKKPFYAALFVAALFAFPGCSDDDGDELIGNWKKMSDFEGVPRYGAVSFVINDVAYVGLGNNATYKYLTDLWRYNPASGSQADTWTQMASFPGEPRSNAVAFGAGSVGVVGTGYNGSEEYKPQDYVFSDFYRFNPSSNTWSTAAEFGGGSRYAAVAFSVGGKGYVGTGRDGAKNNLKDFWCYDPSADTWTQVASIGGSKRVGASAFVIGNTAYVVGGENNSSNITDFWAYDAATDSWIEKRKISNASTDSYDDDYTSIQRSYGVAFVIDGKGYLATGRYATSGTNSSTWEYDPQSDLWTERTAIEASVRNQAVGFTVGGRGYVLTGITSSSYFDDVLQFFPTEEKDDYDN